MVPFALVAILFASCSGNDNTENQSASNADSSASVSSQTAGSNSPADDKNMSVSGVVTGYLQIKNALASDDSKEAASGGNAMKTALQKVDTSSLTADQRKAYADIADDAMENAEHIGASEGKLDHQREHFSMLSGDMYDLVKAMGSNQKLYKDSCPMYDNNKGAIWLSETKDIKNPYLGKKMPTCGSVKEEINNQ